MAVGASELIHSFTDQATRVGAVVQRVEADTVVPAVLTALSRLGCTTVALAEAVSARIDLSRALAESCLRVVDSGGLTPNQRADAGLSEATLGVAETGSVLLHSSGRDRRVELCVDHHLILLASGLLRPTLDEAFVVLRQIAQKPPAYASLVSGPSRSADIERTLTVGVHGPRSLTILLLVAGQ